MTTAILGILAALIPFLIWQYKRNVARKEDPKIQNEQRYEQADKDIVSKDSASATVNSNADLDELDRLQR